MAQRWQRKRGAGLLVLLLAYGAFLALSPRGMLAQSGSSVVNATTLRGKVMCGYQGWFRAPGDPSGYGWKHWSRNAQRIGPETVPFEMWPDMSAYPAAERYPAPGFTYPDGKPAELFSPVNAATVERHFEWMRDYGLDGAWLQRFVAELGIAGQQRVLDNVRQAARATGRAWAITYDTTGMPPDQIFETIKRDWENLVATGVTSDANYLHQDGRPVVEIFCFHAHNPKNHVTPELCNQLIDYFGEQGSHRGFLVAGADHDWLTNPDPAWQAAFRRVPAICPWTAGPRRVDAANVIHADTATWAREKQICAARGQLWIPIIYPGYSADNLKRLAPGTTTYPRRAGKFFWEQFHVLSALGGADAVFIAMFDEVDEGTAIFKVTNTPPTQAHFLGLDGMPSDWYLRLAGAGADYLRRKEPVPAQIHIRT